MARGLIPLGVNTANQALTGLTKEAGLANAREIASKRMELEKDIARQGSQQQIVSDIISTAISFFTFGMGGGFVKKPDKDKKTSPSTAGDYLDEAAPMTSPTGDQALRRRELMAPDISASAREGIEGLEGF